MFATGCHKPFDLPKAFPGGKIQCQYTPVRSSTTENPSCSTIYPQAAFSLPACRARQSRPQPVPRQCRGANVRVRRTREQGDENASGQQAALARTAPGAAPRTRRTVATRLCGGAGVVRYGGARPHRRARVPANGHDALGQHRAGGGTDPRLDGRGREIGAGVCNLARPGCLRSGQPRACPDRRRPAQRAPARGGPPRGCRGIARTGRSDPAAGRQAAAYREHARGQRSAGPDPRRRRTGLCAGTGVAPGKRRAQHTRPPCPQGRHRPVDTRARAVRLDVAARPPSPAAHPGQLPPPVRRRGAWHGPGRRRRAHRARQCQLCRDAGVHPVGAGRRGFHVAQASGRTATCT